MRVLRRVDSAVALALLRGCPHKVVCDGRMICQEQFLVYDTRGKKRKTQVITVLLHPSMVVLARRRKERQKGVKKSCLEFYDALDVRRYYIYVCCHVCPSLSVSDYL